MVAGCSIQLAVYSKNEKEMVAGCSIKLAVSSKNERITEVSFQLAVAVVKFVISKKLLCIK